MIVTMGRDIVLAVVIAILVGLFVAPARPSTLINIPSCAKIREYVVNHGADAVAAQARAKGASETQIERFARRCKVKR